MKKIIILIAYNILVITIFLILAEILVRIFIPEIKSQGTDKNLIVDSVYCSSQGLKPNSKGISNGEYLITDKYGLRKTSIPVDTSKNSILLLGDSVTMGLAIESDSTFAAILNSNIKSRNVLNPSMFGYNINDYKNVFHHLINKDELKIKDVILCWCLNDIYNEEINVLEIPGGKVRFLFSDILTYLRRHSRLYMFIKSSVSDRSKNYFLFDSELYKNKKLVKNSLQILNEIKAESKRRNFNFYILLLPYEYQLRIFNNFPQSELKEKLNGISILDPLNEMRDLSYNSRNYYLYGDGIHFSNLGHRTIAEYIIRKFNSFTESKVLIPCK